MLRPRHDWRRASLAAVFAAAGASAEPGFVHLATSEGALSLRYRQEDARESVAGVSASRRERFFQERLRWDWSGDVYSPRFLNFAVGGGGALSQERASQDRERLTRPVDVEYGGRAELFPKHPAGGSVQFDRAQTTTFNFFSGVARLENSRVMGVLGLREGPVPSVVSYREAWTRGGFAGGFRQNSRSVNWMASMDKSLPFQADLIQEDEWFRDSLGAGFDRQEAQLRLSGQPDSGVLWNWRSAFRRRTGSLESRSFESSLDSSVAFGAWRAGFRPRGEDRRDGDRRSSKIGAGASLSHQLYESLTSELSADADRSRTADGTEDTVRGAWRENYLKRVWGPVRLGVDLGAEGRLQRSRLSALPGTVIDEPLDLADGTVVLLSNLYAEPSSVELFSSDGLRRFSRGSDFEVIPQGVRVEIRRVITGNIAPGERVLARYRLSVPGRRETRDLGRRAKASLLLGRRGAVYAGVAAQDQDAGAAAPTVETVRERTAGLDLRWRYFSTSQSWTLRRSDIVPSWSFHSTLTAGSGQDARLRGQTVWSYDRTRLLNSGLVNEGSNLSMEAAAPVLRGLELGLKLGGGRVSTAGVPSLYKTAEARLYWSYRAVRLELSDRYSWRRVSGGRASENIVYLEITRSL